MSVNPSAIDTTSADSAGRSQTGNAASVLILGRQPALGLAELERLFGASVVTPAGPQAALLQRSPDAVDFNRLGGSLKLAKLLTRLDTDHWPAIEKYLRQTVPRHLQYVPEGKMKLGLSAYGFTLTAAKLNATGLTLKKIIRNAGRSVRVVPNKTLELNSAQVLHNQLTSATGWELLLIRDGAGTIIAQTTAVQDIDAYAARDQGRPKRDARVGMLPPKLAQLIVNLAAGPTSPTANTTILDPFCGTGVVLQEAALMGFGLYGTDLEPRMVDYTAKNLDWLAEQHHINLAPVLEVGDATTHSWNFALAPHPTADQPGLSPRQPSGQPSDHTIIVAAETYLGQPFSSLPSPEKLEQVRSAGNAIHRKFLQNIGQQLPSGARLCLAVPAWQTKPGQFQHLATLDHLDELGYNRMSFKHVSNADLVYARPDQIVGRELLVLTKK